MTARKKNVLAIAVLLAVVSFFALRNESNNIHPSLTSEALTVRGAADTVFSVALEDIWQVTLVEAPDYGAGGDISHGVRFGTWKNDSWGGYQLLAREDINACILIYTTDATYAFNFENLETTRNFYSSFLEFLAVSKL